MSLPILGITFSNIVGGVIGSIIAAPLIASGIGIYRVSKRSVSSSIVAVSERRRQWRENALGVLEKSPALEPFVIAEQVSDQIIFATLFIAEMFPLWTLAILASMPGKLDSGRWIPFAAMAWSAGFYWLLFRFGTRLADRREVLLQWFRAKHASRVTG